jgi:hypothetical protein
MPTFRLLALAAALCLISAQAACAGAPLKGIDVKLGKNPGGGCAARLTGAADQCATPRATDDAGQVDYGVLPKGDYTLTVSPPLGPAAIHVAVAGVPAGAIERDISLEAAGRGAPIAFSMDGTAPLTVTVTSGPPTRDCPGRCADTPVSHSNTNNN